MRRIESIRVGSTREEVTEGPVPMTDEKFVEILIRLDERTEQIGESVEKIAEAVYGNGKPGLITQVAVIAERVATLEEPAKNRWPRFGLYVSLVPAAAVLIDLAYRLLHG